MKTGRDTRTTRDRMTTEADKVAEMFEPVKEALTASNKAITGVGDNLQLLGRNWT